MQEARHLLDRIVEKVNNKLTSLQDTGTTLDKEMRKQINTMRTGIKDYTNIRANLGNVKDTLTNVAALEKRY